MNTYRLLVLMDINEITWYGYVVQELPFIQKNLFSEQTYDFLHGLAHLNEYCI